jgi:predicted GIY-YIG superfamily endonuclease
MTTNGTPDEPVGVRWQTKAAVRTVFAGIVANALTQFAIQAYMSYRFARDVWTIPQPLCVAVIVALDLFAVMFMVFTYLLRSARWYTQIYVWLVFAAGIGAQLFAAELYGAHENWALPVRWFAALPALFLAASLHGLIIWRNHSAEPEEPTAPKIGAWVYRAWTEDGECIYIGVTTDIVQRLRSHRSEAQWWTLAANITEVAYATFDEAVAVERAAIKAERPQFNRQHNPDLPKRRAENAAPPLATSVRRTEGKAQVVKSGVSGPSPVRRKSNPSRDDAVRRVSAGEDTAVVAADLGVTRRAVQIWVQKAHESGRPPVIPELTASVFTQSDPEPVNGYEFGAATQAGAG